MIVFLFKLHIFFLPIIHYYGKLFSADHCVRCNVSLLAFKEITGYYRSIQNQLLTLMHIRSRNPIHTQTAHRTTRQTSKYNIKIPRPKTQLLKNAPCYKGAQIWNALPEAHKALELRPFNKYIKHKTETSTPTHT